MVEFRAVTGREGVTYNPSILMSQYQGRLMSLDCVMQGGKGTSSPNAQKKTARVIVSAAPNRSRQTCCQVEKWGFTP